VLASLRARIAELYATPDDGARSTARSQLESDARAALRALPLTSRAAAELAARIQLQDACLALAGTYERDLPVWTRRLDALGGDLPAFMNAARAAARTADPRTALASGRRALERAQCHSCIPAAGGARRPRRATQRACGGVCVLPPIASRLRFASA
jgi:predicted aminopeptidase